MLSVVQVCPSTSSLLFMRRIFYTSKIDCQDPGKQDGFCVPHIDWTPLPRKRHILEYISPRLIFSSYMSAWTYSFPSSEVQRVRLSRNNCMINVESL